MIKLHKINLIIYLKYSTIRKDNQLINFSLLKSKIKLKTKTPDHVKRSRE